MIRIDGTMGEGGGQVLRSSLSLSMLTGQPFRIENIRGKRRKSGLLRQHLTAVNAASAICGARVDGAALRSEALSFSPNAAQPGEYHFDIGTAGSTSLVLQTILLPLALAGGPSVVTIEGGTHNGKAPPFHFLQRVFVPLLAKMGAQVELSLDRYGFYPRGGGRIHAHIQPTETLSPLSLVRRGELCDVRVEVVISALPPRIATDEIEVIRNRLGLDASQAEVHIVDKPIGPGNVVWIEAEMEAMSEMFSIVGEKGVHATVVANRLCDDFERWRAADVPVGDHLADQLLLPLVVAGSGEFVTGELSEHVTTNMAVIQRFLDAPFKIERRGSQVRVSLR